MDPPVGYRRLSLRRGALRAGAAGYCHRTRCQRRTGTAASAQARIDGRTLRILDGGDLVRAWRHPDVSGAWRQYSVFMASSNLDLVQSIYAAWERDDFSSVAWAHDQIEYVTADGPAPGSALGAAGMAGAFRDFLNVWDKWRVEAEEYLEVDDERVLVLFHFRAQGKGSGLEIGQIWTKGASLFHLRDGKVARLVQYFDRGRALAELGLPREAGSPGR